VNFVFFGDLNCAILSGIQLPETVYSHFTHFFRKLEQGTYQGINNGEAGNLVENWMAAYQPVFGIDKALLCASSGRSRIFQIAATQHKII